MTGGRHRIREDELPCPYFPPPPLALSDAEVRADQVLAAWKKAARLRRQANLALGVKGISFSRWRVLHAVDRLERQTGDAVSQLDVVRHTEMDMNTVSAVMRRLAHDDLVSCGFDAWGFSHRIVVTSLGLQLLSSTLDDFLRATSPFLAAEAKP